MKTVFKNSGVLIIYLITAIAIIVSALVWKDTPYENAWLYILAVGFVLAAFAEMSSKRKDKR